MARANWCSRLTFPDDNLVLEETFAVEIEEALEMGAAQEKREPVTVVGPHLVVGNLVERGPEGDGFGGLGWLALEIVGEENSTVQAVAIAELEMQFAPLLGVERGDAKFLESFAEGGGERSFAPVDFTARTVNFPRAEAALLADKKNLSVAHNKEEIGADARLPGCPIGHVAVYNLIGGE